MRYREATLADAESIALLHAQSWQRHYRGILREEYLQNQVKEDRRQIWQTRLQAPPNNQYVLVADEENTICGLACVYAREDPVWGSLLDNLHVAPTYKGQSIGTRLLLLAARWAYRQDPTLPFYLWVYAQNDSARQFYARLGGSHAETQRVENPGGGYADACRYVWTDVARLMDHPLLQENNSNLPI